MATLWGCAAGRQPKQRVAARSSAQAALAAQPAVALGPQPFLDQAGAVGEAAGFFPLAPDDERKATRSVKPLATSRT